MVDDPRAAPARPAAAAGQPALERHTRRLRQLRRAAQRDRVARVQGEEVRDVTVAGLGLVEVLQPLLELPVLADLIRRQPVERPLEAFAELRILARGAARIASPKSARVIAKSIVAPTQSTPSMPFSSRKVFSGECEGFVTSRPCSSSTRKSSRNSEASFMTG